MNRLLVPLAAVIVAIGFGPALARLLRRKQKASRKPGKRAYDDLRLTNL